MYIYDGGTADGYRNRKGYTEITDHENDVGFVFPYTGICQSYHHPQNAVQIEIGRCRCLKESRTYIPLATAMKRAVKICEMDGQNLCDDKAQYYRDCFHRLQNGSRNGSKIKRIP